MSNSSRKRLYAVSFALLAVLSLTFLYLGQPLNTWKSHTLGSPKDKPAEHNGEEEAEPSYVVYPPYRGPITVPPWNAPPAQHVPEATALFMGFTRNWNVLQQAVVGYVTAGWPPEDIYVVENTGTMQSNANNELSPDNPRYLDYEFLTKTLGVNVLTAPTYLSFAQLQNFYLFNAITHKWPQYFWSHMDVGVMTNEDYDPFSSLYSRAVDALREAKNDTMWGIRFFAYDQLTLVNTAAYSAIGGWDPFISYYNSDCDFHFRLNQAGYKIEDVRIGHIYDVANRVQDLSLFSRLNTTEATESCLPVDIEEARKAGVVESSKDGKAYGRGDCRFHALRRQLATLDHKKQAHKSGRNYWQTAQTGGQGEPFWQDPVGFEKALEMHIENGKKVFEKKWSHGGCDLKRAGNSCKDQDSCSAWRPEKKVKVQQRSWFR